MSDGDPILGTGISAVTPEVDATRLTYQLLNGEIQQKLLKPDTATVTSTFTDTGFPVTPLASVTWDDGKEVHVYSLDSNYYVQDHYLNNGSWTPGKLSGLKVVASPNAGLAVTQYDTGSMIQLRVYYQEAGTYTIKELVNDDGTTDTWYRGTLSIMGALANTYLAAVTDGSTDEEDLHIFYQTQDLYLKDYRHANGVWNQGKFNPGRATARTPLGAIWSNAIKVQVYWHDLSGNVVFAKYGQSPTIVAGISPGHGLSVIQWSDGTNIRIYYQNLQGAFYVHCSDDSGTSWYDGGVIS